MGGSVIVTLTGLGKLALGHSPIIFSLLAALAVLVTPLLTALPAYADWGANFRLTNAAGNSALASIVVSGNNVHVAWQDARDGNWEIYYKRSTDGGTTWGADTRLTNNSGDSKYPSITVSDNNVHIVWQDNLGIFLRKIYYKRSTDGGATWGADTLLSSIERHADYPSVIASGNNVHVAWMDTRVREPNWDIYYKRSTDGGATWGTDTRLTSGPGDAEVPSISVSDYIVHVAWQDSRNGNYEIYYKRSIDGGATWGADTRLTNAMGNSKSASVAVFGNIVHVVWYDSRDGNDEIYYKHSLDRGATWGADVRLTNTAGVSGNPSIAVSGDTVHVAWYDERDGNPEIYYKRSTDGGVTWGADTRLTNAAGNSYTPSIVVSVNTVHIAWHDNRDGNEEIYYMKYTANVPIITSVNPAQANQGNTLTVMVTGNNFNGAIAVAFGGGIVTNSFTVNSAAQITASITIPTNTVTGSRNVSVSTPDGTGTLNNGFTVNAARKKTNDYSSPTVINPPHVHITGVNVQSTQVSANQPVTVYASLLNDGDMAGNLTASLKINGQVEQTQSYTVSGQSERSVQFTVCKNTPGTYTVDVNGKQASFTVVDSKRDSAGSPNVILLICCVAAFVVVSVLLVKRLSS